MLSREWFSPAELAVMGLPALPATPRGITLMADRGQWQRPDWKNSRWRDREGRGGGIEYHYSVLPQVAQIKLAVDLSKVEQDNERETAKRERSKSEMWGWYERLPDVKKQDAQRRLEALDAVRALERSGLKRTFAAQQVAAKFGVALASLYNWQKQVYGIDRPDWLPYLAPRHAGRVETVECHPDAWEALKSDYLRLERPAFVDCYRRVERITAEKGWDLPAARTLQRRIEALPEGLRVLAREGVEAIKRMYPAQRRDRGVFHALEAVNADGHKWDVFVRWPDGKVERPVMVAFQDLYSGMILSWRVDRSENKESVRLAFGDMVEQYGIPDHCWLDNGRNFASKWLTGGTPNRYRFKVKEDEPTGIMTSLGVEIHWATPYHGQAKPIERAFRDLAGSVAKHPRFAGAYTGNNPMAKPENYSSAAVPIDIFIATIAEEIAAHNARAGRKSATAQGRSFLETFQASYAESPIRKASAEQRRLWLLAAEAVGTSKTDGHIPLFGNRYWAEFLHAHRGQKLTIRFDPQKLREPMHVYRLDGSYLGAADCIDDVGFANADEARQHAKARNTYMRATKKALEAERSMTPAQVAALLPEPDDKPEPETKVVRLTFGNAALQAAPLPSPETDEDPEESRVLDAYAQAFSGRLRVVHDDPGE